MHVPDRREVGFRQVDDVDEVAHACTVGSCVVGTVDL